jgi:hypothetical protein
MRPDARWRAHERWDATRSNDVSMSYIVRIKTRAFSTRPYTWEIYREGKQGGLKGPPVAKSLELFHSQKAARSAGLAALSSLVEEREKESLMSLAESPQVQFNASEQDDGE